MDENKLKAIVEEAINKELKPVKEDLGSVKEDLSSVKEIQEEHTSKLDALSADMEHVLQEVKATHDEIGLWHARDKREIDEIKRHLDLPVIPDIPGA